jgi:protein-S-isoprenylcysteine O-methyltransferase Ste14
MPKAAHYGFTRTSDFIALVGIVIGSVFEYFSPSSFEIQEGVLWGIGGVLLLGAWALIFYVKVCLRKHGQASGPGRATTVLVTSGPFRWSRNPIYVGVIFVVISIGILLNSIWITLSALLVAFLLHFVLVLPEEEYLTRLFREQYRSYKANTRRWV